eukprot:COSAG03_NODE_1437_length_4080_cov_2.349410_1_plen_39_part_10
MAGLLKNAGVYGFAAIGFSQTVSLFSPSLPPSLPPSLRL